MAGHALFTIKRSIFQMRWVYQSMGYHALFGFVVPLVVRDSQKFTIYDYFYGESTTVTTVFSHSDQPAFIHYNAASARML